MIQSRKIDNKNATEAGSRGVTLLDAYNSSDHSDSAVNWQLANLGLRASRLGILPRRRFAPRSYFDSAALARITS
jgi:hypothetical protein